MFDNANTLNIDLMLITLSVSTLIFWFVCLVCVTLSEQPSLTPAASPPAMKLDCCCFLLQSRSSLVVAVVVREVGS